MTYDYELTLISLVDGENDMGDPIKKPVERKILCDVQSITKSEHYAAAAYGLKPEIVFIVNKYDYENEKDVIFEGKHYKVDRTYIPKKSKDISDFESIELVCSGLVNNNAAT